MLWDLNEGKRLYSLDAGDIIHSLVFSPNRLLALRRRRLAIKIWDLESKVCGDEQSPSSRPWARTRRRPTARLSAGPPTARSSTRLHDGLIRAWHVGLRVMRAKLAGSRRYPRRGREPLQARAVTSSERLLHCEPARACSPPAPRRATRAVARCRRLVVALEGDGLLGRPSRSSCESVSSPRSSPASESSSDESSESSSLEDCAS